MKKYVVLAKYKQDFRDWRPYVIAPDRESAEKWAEEEIKCDRMMRNRTIRAWIEERELNGL